METGYYFFDDEGYMTRVLTLLAEDIHVVNNRPYHVITEFMGIERENAHDEPGFYQTCVYNQDRRALYTRKYSEMHAALKGHAITLINLRSGDLMDQG